MVRDAQNRWGGCVKELDGKKAFVLIDKGVTGLDTFGVVEKKALADSGVDCCIYSEVDANPTDQQVERGAEIFRREKADVLVAVGGEAQSTVPRPSVFSPTT